MSASSICIPGQRIARQSEDTVGGHGTYTRHGFLYSTLAGYLKETRLSDGKKQISVVSDIHHTVVPSESAIVTAKVTSVTPRFCKCVIMSVGKTPLKEYFRGMIRKEDVRATEKDKVEMYKCFRPGDLVVARVLSIGDAQSYLLSTAENELGVVSATSEAGAIMVPVSWCKMQCPKTLAEEFRKVAKVQPQYIEYNV
ncbi:hypothetical protein C0Q70_09450 [Pomacea canaliculata]|uniref:RNA-binding domain-containing protein n=1 Tax=Pomacea canaliculata TaxID=400727 RepID=A0A2T7P9U3_POMCA|nr:exosome complex component CSL4-like [Pomacea canaliculata]PVD30188.1 hypothetical protein C0Q70_09450 [Pomacea canaliculata]